MKNNYKILPTCQFCKFVFIDCDYDQEAYYYCNIDKLMNHKQYNANFYDGNNEEWEESHAVSSAGTCDDWEKQ